MPGFGFGFNPGASSALTLPVAKHHWRARAGKGLRRHGTRRYAQIRSSLARAAGAHYSFPGETNALLARL
jgi:hypothetical protein